MSGLPAPKPFTPLGGRLVRALLAFSVFFTVLAVAVHMVNDYRAGMDSLTQQLTQAQETYNRQLAAALWDVDNPRLRILLEDLSSQPGIATVDLDTTIGQHFHYPMGGGARSQRGDAPQAESVLKVNETSPELGRLRLTGDISTLQAHLLKDALQILAAQFAQYLLLCLLIAVLVNRMVTRHITTLAKRLEDFPEYTTSNPIQLERRHQNSEDEIDLLARGLQQQQEQLHRHLEERKRYEEELGRHRDNLQELVEDRTRQLNEAVQQLDALARQDHLTGIANRRHFDETAQLEFDRALRHQYPLSVLVADVDFFKQYNDTYGHGRGDICLQEISVLLRDVFRRAGEFPARVGGEEFAILLSHADGAMAMTMAERLRQAVAKMQIVHSGSEAAPYVTLSIGLATLDPLHHRQFTDLYADADRALYQAKAAGRNRTLAAQAEAPVETPAPVDDRDPPHLLH